MKSKAIVLLWALLSLAGTAAAETVSCPDLATAVQVMPCPPEDELRYTFTGYCADNARLYGKDSEDCASFAAYKRLKNVALWEAAGGAFHTYLSCEQPADLKAKPTRIAAVRKGTLTQVVCHYGDNVRFTYRTKANCKVEAACTDGACAATCD